MNKNPFVSIIIPTRDSSEFLDTCLTSIKNQTYKNMEIIVVDNNSSDETKQIARRYTGKVYNKGPERSVQRNYGAEKSRGEYLLFVDSDMELDKDVVRECVREIQKDKFYTVIIPEETTGKGFWTECKKLERSYYTGIDWIEAPRFFHRKEFLKIRGFDTGMTGAEDFDLAGRIAFNYGAKSITRVKKIIYHHEGKLSFRESVRKKFFYGRQSFSYERKNDNLFQKQASILERYKLYFKKPDKLLKNPAVGLGMLFLRLMEFFSGGFGYFITKLEIKCKK